MIDGTMGMLTRQALRGFQADGVEAVAVSLLWSMVNPDHEARVGEIIREEMPDAYVALYPFRNGRKREIRQGHACIRAVYRAPRKAPAAI